MVKIKERPDMPTAQQFADVNGKRIAYLEAGSGDPIVLLHGNPTSSFLWRRVVPELVASGRVIVPDSLQSSSAKPQTILILSQVV